MLPQWMAAMMIVNAIGIVLLVMVIFKWSPRENPDMLNPQRPDRGSDSDDNDNNGGGWGHDPKLPIVDLPPGTSLGDWLTDRPSAPKKERIPLN